MCAAAGFVVHAHQTLHCGQITRQTSVRPVGWVDRCDLRHTLRTNLARRNTIVNPSIHGKHEPLFTGRIIIRQESAAMRNGLVCLSATLLMSVALSAARAEEPALPGATPPPRESTLGADRFSRGPRPNWIVDVATPEPKPSTEPSTVRLGDLQIRWAESGETAFYH